VSAPLRGGIIAAGDGDRLRAAGYAMPKPLVPVGGEPLLVRLIANFAAAGIGELTVIVNDFGRACCDILTQRFPDLEVRCIVKTTRSSLESFFEVAHDPSPGRMLIATVDAVCAADDFVRFVAAAVARPPEATVLGITPLVSDEKPFWVNMAAGGRVQALGGTTGDFVTAGFYLVPDRVRRMTPAPHLTRLREFLASLALTGERLYGEIIDTVVDVDRAEDVVLAEALIRAGWPAGVPGGGA
jgi:NDP-sugar pyrophosphorylase family protein